MKILLLSAYDAASHRRWHQQLQQMLPQDDWTVLTLPARYFSWRVRGNSLSWAFGERHTLEQCYDLVIATSMVDLSALRGFVPSLGQTPTLVYFHENQFAYPASARQFSSIEPQLLNLYTALAADRVAFNSEYNRQSFLDGAQALLEQFPDCVPAGLVERLASHSEVLPVPLESACFGAHQPVAGKRLEVLWNHRWEYDKGPDRLLAIIRELDGCALPLNLHIVGQQFRQQPGEFEEILAVVKQSETLQLQHWGYVNALSDYRSLLSRADVVLSTAVHDFQGLAVLEAVAAGCLPLLPARLCYQEWFDEHYLYPSAMEDPAAEAAGVVTRLQSLSRLKNQSALPVAPDISWLGFDELQHRYKVLFSQLAKANAHGQERGE